MQQLSVQDLLMTSPPSYTDTSDLPAACTILVTSLVFGCFTSNVTDDLVSWPSMMSGMILGRRNAIVHEMAIAVRSTIGRW